MSGYDDLKERVFRCNMALPENGLVLHNFGNASGCDRERGVVAIKPSGVPYTELTAADMVVLDLDGSVIEGKLRPSSDTRTHLVLYREWPEIQGVVHTHSTCAVAWAQARRPIPVLGTTHADHLAVDVPCCDFLPPEQIAADYETAIGQQIVGTFRERNLAWLEVPMVLVAGHGPFTWGPTPEKAVYHCVVLEELARMALLTLQIAPDTPPLPQALVDKHFSRKHGPQAYYGQKK